MVGKSERLRSPVRECTISMSSPRKAGTHTPRPSLFGTVANAFCFLVIARSQRVPALGGPDDKLRDEAIHIELRGAMDCFTEPVIGRAFARPVGSQCLQTR